MNEVGLDKITYFKKALSEQGVCLAPALFSKSEINSFCAEANRLWETQEHRVAQNLRLGLRKDAQGQMVLDRMDPVEDISELFYQLNRHKKLLAIMESIFQDNAVVMKEKLIFKLPGTQGFSVHRDEPYFSISGVPGDKIISIAIALDEAKKENGNIEFFPELTKKTLTADKNEQRDIAADAVIKSKVFSPKLKAGDAVLYNALIPHQSGINTGEHPRRTYTISYAPARYAECRQNYYQTRYQQQQEERQAKIDGPFFIK